MGKGAGTASYVLAFVCAVAWLAAICTPTGWQAKDCGGILMIYAGLFKIESDKSFWGNAASLLLGKYGRGFTEVMKGTSTIRDMKDQVCAVDGMWTKIIGPNDSCGVWTELLYGSWMMAIFGFFTVIFFLCAAGFSYQYWQNEAREEPRKWARLFFIAAPCTGLLGVLIYTGCSWNFSNWMNTFGSSSSVGYSHAYMLSCFLCVISWVPCILNESFARYSWAEAGNEARADFRKEQREDALMEAQYGATAGGYGATGGYPAGTNAPPPAGAGGYAQQPQMGSGGYAPAPMGFGGQEQQQQQQMGFGGPSGGPMGFGGQEQQQQTGFGGPMDQTAPMGAGPGSRYGDQGSGFTMPPVGPQY